MFRAFLFFTSVFWASIVQAQAPFWTSEWPNTDFSKTAVPFVEILSGGPPRDGIPALNNPKMIMVSAEMHLAEREPVMTLELAGKTPRAYPVRYLMWHEIVNDVIADTPIAVTFCPLCNSGVTFDRRHKGQILTFGVSGKLRNSDMIMFDRETESWWQQFSGQAIVGDLLGVKLVKIPSWMESWNAFKTRNPNGEVMAKPSASRQYGINPYVGYDSTARPFLYNGEMPPHGILPLERVVVVGKKAWPLKRIVQSAKIEENGLEITWSAGMTSALDSRKIAKGKDVGTIRVRESATGRDVVHDVAFAFAFHAFHPQGTWMVSK